MPSKYAVNPAGPECARAKVSRFDVREIDSQPVPLHRIERAADARIGLAAAKPAFAIVLPIGRHGFADPTVPIGLQQNRHHLFDRRPDDPADVACCIRLMPQRPQRRQAARQDAGLRIDQSAVEIQKNRACHGHGWSITAKRRSAQPGLLSLRIFNRPAYARSGGRLDSDCARGIEQADCLRNTGARNGFAWL